MHPILIPVTEIDAAALPRDRTGLEPDALDELRLSIATSGLRMPIEVWELAPPAAPGAPPRGTHRYGLISGFRRLQAFRDLHATAADKTPYAAIPAFVREPASYAAALAAMVEENAIRADLSPFERGLIAVTARNAGIYASIEEAVNALYASATGAKRTRLRALAFTAEELDGHFTQPEKLSLRQCLRLADAIRKGYGELIRTAVTEIKLQDHESQWQAVLPILAEAERADIEDPIRDRGDRPRRILRPRHTLTVRRELTRDGWILRFTGKDATGMLIDSVMDEIERWLSPS